jgi:hypothetical protein
MDIGKIIGRITRLTRGYFSAPQKKSHPLFYESLSEKDKRRYAAIETLKLPYGGQSYISEVLRCDPKTIQQGLSDFEDEQEIKKKG